VVEPGDAVVLSGAKAVSEHVGGEALLFICVSLLLFIVAVAQYISCIHR
jgi:hypothetical protein